MDPQNGFVGGQQDVLAQSLENLSFGSSENLNTTQNSNNKAPRSKRRGNHAFHNLTSQSQLLQDSYVDPNEAAFAIGLVPPQMNASNILNQTPTMAGTPAFQQQGFVQALEQHNSNAPTQQLASQIDDSKHVLRSPKVQERGVSENSDLYNINTPTVIDDLSISSLRNKMNETYQKDPFLSFEHVSPPLAGTRYQAIDQANATPHYSRMTLYSVPYSEELRKQSKIPLGMVLRPFAEFVPESEVPMKVPQIKIFQGQTVPRCRRCRAYLNPGMQYGINTMTCNICGFVSPVPEEYAATVDHRGIREDYHIRPELHTGVVDYVVPKDYNLDSEVEPNPTHRVFLIDLTHSAYKSKLVETVCSAVRMSLYKDDGTSNLPEGTKIAIVGYDTSLHFYDLSPGLLQASVSIVTDLEDPFIPFEGGLFVDPVESSDIIELTLATIDQSIRYIQPEPALGSALKVCGDLLSEVGGGQIIAVLSTIPSFGPGNLIPKQQTNGKSDLEFIKETTTADNKYYQQLTDKFIKNNIGVNLFVASQSNVDLINLASFATGTGGTIRDFLPFNVERDEITLIFEIKKAVQNLAGYQCQLKIRCSHGLHVKNYYGPFPTTSGVNAPTIAIVSGDTSIVADFAYDNKLDTKKDAHFQAALLYTSKDGVRKVRVVNSILSVTQKINHVFDFSDQDAVAKVLITKACENFRSSALTATKNSLIMECAEIMASYKHHVASYNAMPTQLILPQSLKTLPMTILAVLKSKAFRQKLHFSDLRVDSLTKLSQYNLTKLSTYLYPALFCIHSLDEDDFMVDDETGLMNIGKMLPLSVSNLEFGGAYLIFNCDRIFIWLHSEVNPLLLQDLFGPHIDSLSKVTSHISSLPDLDTYISHQVRNMISFLTKHYNGLEKQSIEICRFRVDPNEMEFHQMFVEEKSDDLVWSYADFLKELHKQIDIKEKGISSLNSANSNDNDGENISRKFGIF